MAATIDLAHVYGWKVAHFRPAMTSKGWRTPVGADGKGFPDLVLCKPGPSEIHGRWKFSEPSDLLFVELKSDAGKVTPEQEEWIDALEYHAETRVWRPADWNDGTILATLKGDPGSGPSHKR